MRSFTSVKFIVVTPRGVDLAGNSTLELLRPLFGAAKKPRAGYVHRTYPFDSLGNDHEKAPAFAEAFTW